MNTLSKKLFVLSFITLTLSSSLFAADSVVKIRVMASNLSNAKGQTYQEEGIRIIQGLRPDVVLMQEFNYLSNSPEEIGKFVFRTLGKKAVYTRESEESDDIPNGIISRYPILDSGEWQDTVLPNRDFVWARIDIPGDRDLWAISVHMKASKDSKAKRVAQARAIMELVQKNIPAKDYVVLGGDSNASNKTEQLFPIFAGQEITSGQALTTLTQPAFPSKYKDGEPNQDSVEGNATNMTDRYPYDIILGDEDINAVQIPVVIRNEEASLTFTHGLVFDSTIFPNLDLVSPAKKEDSRVPGMQHLGVVKDFAISVPSAEPSAQETKPETCTNSQE